MRFIQVNGKGPLIPAEQVVRENAGPYVIPDTPEYISPVTWKPVRGRVQRREDLRRAGCVEVGPNDFKR